MLFLGLIILKVKSFTSQNNWRKQDFSNYITAKVETKKDFSRFYFQKF